MEDIPQFEDKYDPRSADRFPGRLLAEYGQGSIKRLVKYSKYAYVSGDYKVVAKSFFFEFSNGLVAQCFFSAQVPIGNRNKLRKLANKLGFSIVAKHRRKINYSPPTAIKHLRLSGRTARIFTIIFLVRDAAVIAISVIAAVVVLKIIEWLGFDLLKFLAEHL